MYFTFLSIVFFVHYCIHMVLSIILRRYELDPMGNTKEKASILCPQIEDVFGLKLHTFEDNKKLQGKVNHHIFVALIAFYIYPVGQIPIQQQLQRKLV